MAAKQCDHTAFGIVLKSQRTFFNPSGIFIIFLPFEKTSLYILYWIIHHLCVLKCMNLEKSSLSFCLHIYLFALTPIYSLLFLQYVF